MNNHTKILLESGTNEFEIMEFTIAGQLYGINVAKVREIMVRCPVNPMQKSHPDVEGVFKSRDMVITVINLAQHLNLPPSEHQERDIFIISNFNNTDFAFHVHGVVGIDRISWTQIKKPDKIIYGGDEGVATGIADFEGRLITILDFEKIVTEINPELGIQVSEIEKMGDRGQSSRPVLVVEDSMLLSKMIVETLHRAGYNNIIKLENGQDAWNYLEEAKASGDELAEHVACVISDIEMPQMDGLRLTKLIKSDAVLKKLPVILFSSLINEEMRLKCIEMGADAQITKPEIGNLVRLLDQFMAKLPKK